MAPEAKSKSYKASYKIVRHYAHHYAHQQVGVFQPIVLALMRRASVLISHHLVIKELTSSQQVVIKMEVDQVPPSPDSAIESDAPMSEDEGEYEVDFILAKRRRNGTWEYLVVWVGYPIAEATWEPEEHLDNADLAVREFERRHRARRYWERRGEI